MNNSVFFAPAGRYCLVVKSILFPAPTLIKLKKQNKNHKVLSLKAIVLYKKELDFYIPTPFYLWFTMRGGRLY